MKSMHRADGKQTKEANEPRGELHAHPLSSIIQLCPKKFNLNSAASR